MAPPSATRKERLNGSDGRAADDSGSHMALAILFSGASHNRDSLSEESIMLFAMEGRA